MRFSIPWIHTMEPRYFFFLASLILGITIGLKRFKKLTHKYRLLFVLIFFVFITNGIFAKFLAFEYQNNHLATHLIIPIQCILYGEIYSDGKKQKFLIQFICYLLAILSILNTVYNQSYNSFPSNMIVALYSLMIPLILFDMTKLLDIQKDIPLVKNSDFWLNLGGLVFFLSTYFTFSLLNPAMDVIPYWVILLIAICNIFLYLSYAIALYCNSRFNEA